MSGNSVLIGKKQLLLWASECCGMECHKYDDMRDGLVPLVIFKALFPHGVPPDYASSMRAQMSQTPMQRHSRQNWAVLQQLLRAAGVPPTVWDRRAVAAAHPKACYNFLVMAYFLHKLRGGDTFSVDFALPVDPDLSAFLQSPRSLEVVNRATTVRPVSTSTRAHSSGRGGGGGTAYAHSDPEASGTDGNRADYGSSSADITPTLTPRGGAVAVHHQQHPETTIFLSPTGISPQQQQQQQQQQQHHARPVSPMRSAKKIGSATTTTATAAADSGWRYGADTASLGEAQIERLRAENARLQDAMGLADAHARATEQFCAAQLAFAHERFDVDVRAAQAEARLGALQHESQAVLQGAVAAAGAEARLRELERRIVLEKRESAWATFADDPVPNDCAADPQRWLAAQLDAARKGAALERQHRLALESENELLREQVGKFMPMISKMQQEATETADKIGDALDPQKSAAAVADGLANVRAAADAQHTAKIAELEKELQALRTTGRGGTGAAAAAAAATATAGDDDSVYALTEELHRTRSQLERALQSSSLLRDLLHRNCTTAMQRLDLSGISLDAAAEELRPGVVAHSADLGAAASSVSESGAAAQLHAIADAVSKIEGATEADVNSVRDHASRMAMMQQVLEARVASMSGAVRQLSMQLESVEKEASTRHIQSSALINELHSRHAADMQQAAAAKNSEMQVAQNELQALRQQLLRETAEHKALSERQAHAHNAMSADLQAQVTALRQGVAEVRRAEALLTARDQLWAALAESLNILAAPAGAAPAESKFQAETRANQLREELRKNAAELKSSGGGGGGGHQPTKEIADAVREAVQHSREQLAATFAQLEMKTEEAKRLEAQLTTAVHEADELRARFKDTRDTVLLRSEELDQSRTENARLQKRVAEADVTVAHTKELIANQIAAAVAYVTDVATHFRIVPTVERPHVGEGTGGVLGQQHHHHSLADLSSKVRASMTGPAVAAAGGGASSSSAAAAAAAAAAPGAAAPSTTAPSSSSPPRLVAPKFARIELSPSPPKNKTTTGGVTVPAAGEGSAATTGVSSTSMGSAAVPAALKQHQQELATASATTAADAAVDDFARKQQEILSKYGIK